MRFAGIINQRCDQTDKLLMLRAMATAVEERAKFNLGILPSRSGGWLMHDEHPQFCL
jgi:hypothetical protein